MRCEILAPEKSFINDVHLCTFCRQCRGSALCLLMCWNPILNPPYAESEVETERIYQVVRRCLWEETHTVRIVELQGINIIVWPFKFTWVPEEQFLGLKNCENMVHIF